MLRPKLFVNPEFSCVLLNPNEYQITVGFGRWFKSVQWVSSREHMESLTPEALVLTCFELAQILIAQHNLEVSQ